MKRLILILCMTILFSGCGDYSEVEDLTIVTAVALDKNPEKRNKLDICIEVVKFKQNKPNVSYIKASGETYHEAITNAIKVTGNRLYFGHAGVMIISEELGNEGIRNILDSIYRSSEIRLDVNLLVAKGKSAAQMLQTKSLIDDIAGVQIKQMIASNILVSEVPPMPVYEFIDDVSAVGTAGWLPVITTKEVDGEELREISGVALFKEDYIYGYLNKKETKTMGLLTQKTKKGTVINEYIVSTPTYVMESSQSKIKPKLENGQLSFQFDIKMKLRLVDNGLDLLAPTNKKKMEQEITQAVKKDIHDVIQVQIQNPGADFLGLGDLVYRKYTDYWKKNSAGFEQEIKNLQYTLNVECKIADSGLMLKPIEIHN